MMNLPFLSTITRVSDPPNSWSQQRSDPNAYLNYSDNIAVVEEMILPSYKGRVKHQGVSWLAQCEQNVSIQPGDRVLVVDRCNITLIVAPLSDNSRPVQH